MTALDADTRLIDTESLLVAGLLLVARKYITTPNSGASTPTPETVVQIASGADHRLTAEISLPLRPETSLRDHAQAVSEALDRATASWPDRSMLRCSFAQVQNTLQVTALGTGLHVEATDASVDTDGLVRHLGRVLTELADRPELPLGELELADPAERALILDTFNDTRRDYPRDATIHQLFEEQVAARPDAIAVAHADGRVSYGELHAWAAELADAFRAAGVLPGDRVALLTDKTPAMVAATLAVLRLGATYVPVDPSLPAARRDFLLTDSRARLVVTDTDAVLDAVPVHRLGQSTATATALTPVQSPARSGGPEDTAYVMYTSGTTGHPKGVLINQRAVVRLVKGSDLVRLTPQTRILQTGATGFDATTFEVWGALLNGGTLVLVPKETILRADLMARAIADHGVTTMWLTSPLFNQLVEQEPALFDGCELLVGGEALSARHVGMALDAGTDVRIVNGYGPTENTTFSTYHPVSRDDLDRIPIGRPVPNSTAYVLDVDGRLLPPGVTGELHVGGDGLSAGYLNRPDLDEHAFVRAGFGTGERLYRTGDLARWTPAGTLEYLGRADSQVKVRGFRVEPAEAEAALQRVPGVREAVVLAAEGASGKALHAYATADPGLTPDTVLAALTEQLPDYLVPSSLHIVKAMPLNQNGKTDRAALAALPPENPGDRPGMSAPRTPDEEVLAGLFAQILGRDTVGVDDNFFALGGHSLLATRLWVQIRSETGAEIELKEVLETPTVAGLAACLGRRPAASAASARPRLERRS